MIFAIYQREGMTPTRSRRGDEWAEDYELAAVVWSKSTNCAVRRYSHEVLNTLRTRLTAWKQKPTRTLYWCGEKWELAIRLATEDEITSAPLKLI